MGGEAGSIKLGGAGLFFVALDFFGGEAAFFGAFGRFAFATFLRFDEGFDNEFAEFFEAGAAIGFLRAFGVGGEEQVAVGHEASTGEGAEAGDGAVIEAMESGQADAEFGFGVDFVDVLAAGAAGAGEAEAELFAVGPDTRAELNAGEECGGGGHTEYSTRKWEKCG